MNGFDTARELAKLEPSMQILVCTVQLSTYVLKEAERVGIQGGGFKIKSVTDHRWIAALLRNETFYCWPCEATTSKR
jgi:hypothetical protein